MIENYPVLIVKKLVLLPYQEVKLELNTTLSKKIITSSLKEYGDKLLIVRPTNPLEVAPLISDLPKLGVLAKIKNKVELPNGNYRVVLNGLNRVEVKDYFTSKEELLEAKVKRIYIDNNDKNEEMALIRSLKGSIAKYIEEKPGASNSIIQSISNLTDLDMLTDIITNYMTTFTPEKKIEYMNNFDCIDRATKLLNDISTELKIVGLESKINQSITDDLDNQQKEYIIKQRIEKLTEELGYSADKTSEISFFDKKIDELNVSDKTRNKLKNELKKYNFTSESSPDSSVIRNYLDTVLSLPWNTYSNEETDVKKIKKNLDKSHFGLDEAKNRILEYIAIKKNSNNINAPIICLIGPPGTGKTTLGMSISEALNREFYKISVGGLNDSSELTGHRRTYLGASPGRIIQGLKKCGTKNPVILIDEVDKIISDYHGDPNAVLLDILDPAQNNQFIDNYIEEPFDLSNVLFILTANDIKNISSVLRDRLEIIEISSYTEFEKIDIAKKYILPKIFEEYNFNKVKISDSVILNIVNDYTKEAGVRELSRILNKIIRNLIVNDSQIKTLEYADVIKILGPKKYENTSTVKTYAGSANALGVTPYGGAIINFESVLSDGEGNAFITGNIQDGLKESLTIAYKHVLSNSSEYGINKSSINKKNIHVNALNYAFKKDGSSGGLALIASIVSLLLDEKIDPSICFTGEITLHGDVCKVGGIKEKVIAAYNAGLKTIYMPIDNQSDLETIPENIKNELTIKCIDNFKSVYDDLFKKKKKGIAKSTN
jgi:ATP-dependent Lon protease